MLLKNTDPLLIRFQHLLLPIPITAPGVVSPLGQLAPVQIVGGCPIVAKPVIRVHLTGNDRLQIGIRQGRNRCHLDRLRRRVLRPGRPPGRPLRTRILLLDLIILKLLTARARLSPYPLITTKKVSHFGWYATEKIQV